MLIKFATFVTIFALVTYFNSSFISLLAVPSSWLVLVFISWQCAHVIGKHVIVKRFTKSVCGIGKAVLITGADTGFGHLLSLRLNELGFYVYAGCLNSTSDDAQSLVSNAKYRKAIELVQLDVTSDKDIRAANVQVQSSLRIQNRKLYAVVNNAGIASANLIGLTDGPIDDDFRQIMDVNFFGLIKVTRTFLPMIRASKGRIVSVTSIAARANMSYLSAYTASKSAASAFTSTLNYEMMRFGVKVINVQPWFYRTSLLNANQMTKFAEKQWDNASDAIKHDYGNGFIDVVRFSFSWLFNCTPLVDRNLNDVIDELENAITSYEPDNIIEVASVYNRWFVKQLINFYPYELTTLLNYWFDFLTRLWYPVLERNSERLPNFFHRLIFCKRLE